MVEGVLHGNLGGVVVQGDGLDRSRTDPERLEKILEADALERCGLLGPWRRGHELGDAQILQLFERSNAFLAVLRGFFGFGNLGRLIGKLRSGVC